MIKSYDNNISLFLKNHLIALSKEEAANNLIIGTLLSLSKKANPTCHLFAGINPENQHPLYWAVLQQSGFLLISGHANFNESLVNYLKNKYKNHSLKTVFGQKELALSFAKFYKNKFNINFSIALETVGYQLSKINPLEISAGKMRKATMLDSENLSKWTNQFFWEALQESDEEAAKAQTLFFIANQQFFVWEINGQIVSMASLIRETPNGKAISHVFTPKEYRKKGYATSLTKTLSEWVLDNGYSFTCLFADKKNATTNFIYQKIGYKFLADYAKIQFD